jgi:hypothetical protein
MRVHVNLGDRYIKNYRPEVNQRKGDDPRRR